LQVAQGNLNSHNLAMDPEFIAVLSLVIGAVLVAIAAWVISQVRQRRLASAAAEWVPAEAIIESGALEATESNKIVLPTFAFSYQVSGQYYSGHFSLKALLPTAQVESLIGSMIGRKFLVRYDPHRPEVWFIPDKFMDGYPVEQKLGPHLIHDYSPRD
jgi:hypothetical protein